MFGGGTPLVEWLLPAILVPTGAIIVALIMTCIRVRQPISTVNQSNVEDNHPSPSATNDQNAVPPSQVTGNGVGTNRDFRLSVTSNDGSQYVVIVLA